MSLDVCFELKNNNKASYWRRSGLNNVASLRFFSQALIYLLIEKQMGYQIVVANDERDPLLTGRMQRKR